MKVNEILDELELQFPDARCELNHDNNFQLTVAVVLSAQTTDAAVNKITKSLFDEYPTSKEMAKASIKELEKKIKSIGLYHNKAKNISALSLSLEKNFNGIVPNTMEELLELPGVGRKSANVIMSVCYDIPAIAVDTHVERIAKRLGLAYKKDSVLNVEKKLMKKIDKERWNKAHHLFIFFGRYFCTARSPKCDECKFINICKEKRVKSK
ncbi:MAG: endonuclease III [Anaerorhabdus sp.]